MVYRLSTALLASTILAASPAFAQAAPTAEDIAVLRAQIDALQAKVGQLEAQQAATAQTAASAQAQTQAAQTAAATPLPAPKIDLPAWIKGTSISGKAFFNVSNIDHERNGVDQSDNGTQTELKRFYIGVDHKFSDVFSANITTDFRYGTNGTSNDVLVYVKKAFLQAKLDPAFTIRVGAADLPWVPFDEGLYGYRFIENTLIDRTKFGTSSDWGVHVLGTVGKGLLSYQVSAINGAGYKIHSRSSNTIDLEGRVSVNPIKPITLAVGAYTGKLGKSAENGADTRRASRFNALAAYSDGRIRAGVEYFHAKNWANVVAVSGGLPTPQDKSDGWSAFGSFAFNPKMAVFGRYDWVKPSGDINPSLKDHYFNVGLNYKPVKEVDLALVYKRDRANNGFLSTSNGTIGGTKALTDGTYNEVGIFGQFAF
jgi:hypothetical protein